ncbi:MAG TPA: DUF2992 family protein [Treponemataceae bacterium]|nr:DUF2992 family protein [Treponemataceae bacterium]
MERVVTTVMFDGQFWIALIEKIGPDGILSVGKYVFGAEPSNPELVEFMLRAYGDVPARRSETLVRPRAKDKPAALSRVTGKAKAMYAELQKTYLASRAGEKRLVREADEREKYLQKRERRKERKRGH